MEEVWKDIKGFEGVYQISNTGKQKSFKASPEGRILSNKNKKGDYLSVVLQYKGLIRYTRMHILVAEAFVPNPFNKPQINHMDGNKQNNSADNLEWVTPQENVIDAIKRNPSMVKGINEYNIFIRPKTIQQFTLNYNLLDEFPNAVEAGRITGVCHSNILQVASGDEYKPGKTRKQAGGFVWKFKDENGGARVGNNATSQ